MKKASTTLLALATAVALLTLPATAGAEYFIPDGNSAVNQYTEGVPSGGGERSTKGAGDKPVRPAQTLGEKNTAKLEQAGGQEGREVAEVAAETAPPVVVVEEETTSPSDRQPTQKPQKKAAEGDKAVEEEPTGDGATAVIVKTSGDGPSGSGGVGEIVSAATGASDGGVGLLLPLVIVAAIAWGLIYTWRKRTSDPAPTPSR